MTVHRASPVIQHSYPAPPAPAAVEVPEAASVQRTEAILTVNVPTNALVYVNGKKTRSTGSVRQFVSRGLQSNRSYNYDVRVDMMVDGRVVSDSRLVQLKGGDLRTLSIAAPAPAPQVIAAQPAPRSVETALTVHVPTDAKVVLAGNATTGSGHSRTYRTTQLAPGQIWDGYKVTVTVERQGRTVTQSRTLSLVAGSENELTFDFPSATLAMR